MKSFLAIIGHNSHFIILPNMKLGQVIICSNLVLSSLIWFQNAMFVHIYRFSITYLHLPLFTYIWPNLALTRLLCRPQPQIYPPVALNQYSCVNITFYIYGLRPHEYFEIDFTLKLSSQQHVKYGSNLKNMSYYFFHFGGPVCWIQRY